MPFERIKWRYNKDGSKRGYKYLVKNYRENGKSKQKVLKYLGRVYDEVGTTQSKVGTTFKKDLKQEYDSMFKEKRGSMVRIPDLWYKMRRKGYNREEFEEGLFELEKQRIIELQIASDKRLVKDKEDAIDHPSRGLINYVVWRD